MKDFVHGERALTTCRAPVALQARREVTLDYPEWR
jgi:hypothetical protein